MSVLLIFLGACGKDKAVQSLPSNSTPIDNPVPNDGKDPNPPIPTPSPKPSTRPPEPEVILDVPGHLGNGPLVVPGIKRMPPFRNSKGQWEHVGSYERSSRAWLSKLFPLLINKIDLQVAGAGYDLREALSCGLNWKGPACLDSRFTVVSEFIDSYLPESRRAEFVSLLQHPDRPDEGVAIRIRFEHSASYDLNLEYTRRADP